MEITTHVQYRKAQSAPPLIPIAQLDLDPHGIFRRYRPITPLIRREGGSYIVIRARDVELLAVDARTRQMETELMLSRGISNGPLYDSFSESMLLSNGQDHRRRRSPMSRAFAYRLIAELRPRIRTLAHSLVDRHIERGSMNFVDDFAALLPAHLLCEILGLPESDIPRFTHWVYSVSPIFSFSFQDSEIPGLHGAAAELQIYTHQLLNFRRAAPKDDFLSTFAAAVEQEGTLSTAEALSQLITVLVGGTDTTRSAMALQAALLLQHRDQWDAVNADQSLVPGAVAESLRFEPAVGSFPRVAVADIELDGYVIPRNTLLSLSTLAAMRDPAVYEEPDSFNIRRTDHPRRHPVFGAGAHRCLGEALARAELEEGLAVVLERLPRLRLVGELPVLRGHSGIRRLSRMNVAWPL